MTTVIDKPTQPAVQNKYANSRRNAVSDGIGVRSKLPAKPDMIVEVEPHIQNMPE